MSPPGRWLRVTRLRIGLVGLATAALLGGAGYLGHIALENHDRAERWRERSVLLRELAADRTRALNRQTARLNVAATRLRKTQRAVARSEQDVAALEVRQRELAAEKARVEDERAALLSVAGQLESCNESMAGVIQVLADGFQPAVVQVDELVSVCGAARSAVDAYVAAFRTQ